MPSVAAKIALAVRVRFMGFLQISVTGRVHCLPSRTDFFVFGWFNLAPCNVGLKHSPVWLLCAGRTIIASDTKTTLLSLQPLERYFKNEIGLNVAAIQTA